MSYMTGREWDAPRVPRHDNEVLTPQCEEVISVAKAVKKPVKKPVKKGQK
jgi:hypothetical protein